jgi:coproporphyrinogen III oxidase
LLETIKTYLLDLQNRISQMIELEDGRATFREDNWVHGDGGGGKTRIIQEGALIEKGGVNFSHVHGFKLPHAATQKRPELIDASFQAMGVSVVMHPVNPYVPTSHMNVRFISAERVGETPLWWFGGGFDLTPYYPFQEDCEHWHQMAKAACDPFGLDVYPNFKKWADDYFYLPHRNEPRGIGGIFFDDLNQWPIEVCFNFLREVGDHFIKAYHPIIVRRKNTVYSSHEKNFQLFRRGRYVEFNLLYDRGTLFGLQSKGRIDSILMSMPPSVAWPYEYKLLVDSKEEALYKHFLVTRDWV